MKREKFVIQLRGAGVIIKTDAPPRAAEKIEYGFWGVADNNAFHPSVKSAADVIPKPEDYLLIPFRFISATVVAAETWRATCFPNDILKASMPKLLGVPVYTDHDTETVGNCIGHVESVEWQDEYTDAVSGLLIPAGINGKYAIDTKIAPNVARNLYTGNINSNSVTVEFYWKPSHPQMEARDFSDKLGTYDKDGNPICRMVDEITQYLETSPVFRGADPYAKGLDAKGNVSKPDLSMLSYDDIVRTEGAIQQSFDISCKSRINVLRLTKEQFNYQQEVDKNKVNKTTFRMKKEFLAFIATTLGVTSELTELTDAQQDSFLEALKKANPAEASLTSLLTRSELSLGTDVAPFKLIKVEELTALNTEVAALKTETERLKPLAATGASFDAELRTEAERLHNVATGGKTIESTLNLIKTGGIDVVKGLIESFGGQITTHKFTGKCKKCLSTEVSFQSSVGGNVDPKDVIEVDPTSAKDRILARYED